MDVDYVDVTTIITTAAATPTTTIIDVIMNSIINIINIMIITTSPSAGGVPVCMKCTLSYSVDFYTRHPELSEKLG